MMVTIELVNISSHVMQLPLSSIEVGTLKPFDLRRIQISECKQIMIFWASFENFQYERNEIG